MTVAAAVHVDGAFNARLFGAVKPWLLRSSALDALTVDGRSTLDALGVRLVIDLREHGEGGAGAHEVPVLHIPLYQSEDVPATGRIESIYDLLIDERGEALTAAVAAIADATGPIAVHCTIGKDRTGLVVALTLLAAGVAQPDVVADYARSGPEVEPHRRAYVERLLAGMELTDADRADAWRLNLFSPPEAIQHLITRLQQWGGAAEYLRAHGLRPAQLAALQDLASQGEGILGDADHQPAG